MRCKGWGGISFSEIVGMTFSRVEQDNCGGFDGNDAIRFHAEDGRVFELTHSQDCCESVSIESVVGDLSDLQDTPILMAEAASNDDPSASESGTWTFYKLATRKGYVDIRFYGLSNGYYSEGVSFVEVE